MSFDDEQCSWWTLTRNMTKNGHKFDKGIMHKEFVPPGQTVSGKFYCDVLRWQREYIQRKRPDKWCNNSWDLHHDTLAHAPLIVQQFLASTKVTVIPQPHYSPDLVPCDFLLFLKMKLKLKTWHFLTTVKWSRPNHRVMKTLMWNDFQQCFWSSKFHWNHCINSERN
jgi:hypothetical protein